MNVILSPSQFGSNNGAQGQSGINVILIFKQALDREGTD